MSAPNPKVDSYIRSLDSWRDETARLRSILLGCGLDETVKWSKPCYAIDGGNVAIIQGFKAYCALLFFKGSLLDDPKKILAKTGPNSQAGRQIRFTSVKEIDKLEPAIKAYVKKAVENEKAGLKVDVEKKKIPVPAELRNAFAALPALKDAFEALTPGRRRGYLYHFSSAKRPETREARVAKNIQRILRGKGLED
jgi:uncharacterized protein YdeI (YjbR/CyaY-like superfamily)